MGSKTPIEDIIKITITKAMKNNIAGNIIDVRFKGFCGFDCLASSAYVLTPMLAGTVVTSKLFGEMGDPHCEQKTDSLLIILFPQLGQSAFFLVGYGINCVPQLLQKDDLSSIA